MNDKVTVLYMLTNGVQQTEDFNNFKSSHVAAILKPTSRVTWTANYYFGQEQPDDGRPDGPDGYFKVIDSYIAYTATPKSELRPRRELRHQPGAEGRSETALQGTGVYARYQASAPTALSLRYERLDDEGLFGGIEQVLQEVTLTLEHKFADGFLLRGEFRRDWSNEALLHQRPPRRPAHQQNTALVGLVWWFGNKQGAW